MANLALCKKCENRDRFYRGKVLDNGQRLLSAQVWCKLNGFVPVVLGWDSEVSENCPYRMEHLVTMDAMADLAEDAKDFKDSLILEAK